MYDALDGVWEHLYGGPVAHGTRLCLTSALCCMLLAFVIRGILRMVLARLPAYAGLPVSQRVLIANKGPSLVHAIVATVFGFQSMTDPELTSNPIYGMNDKLVVRASATLGYMLYVTLANSPLSASLLSHAQPHSRTPNHTCVHVCLIWNQHVLPPVLCLYFLRWHFCHSGLIFGFSQCSAPGRVWE
eukprot:m.212428 g.212428  ORF g.212428 m.212428 type:complete len:187 (+) comp18587_c0_seq1:160-720(+)